MGNTNDRRAEQLGMPFGTACSKLRKNILFSLLHKHQENFCFKCGLPITTPDELSIEHKQYWLDRSPDLFWDMGNIAFSHMRCNRPDRPYSEIIKKNDGPEGTSWCRLCKDYLPVDRFHRNSLRWNGLADECIPHKTQRNMESKPQVNAARRKKYQESRVK